MPRPALTDTQIEEFRRRACKVALDLYRKDGAEGVSLRSLGNKLGVSRMAAYRYFASRDELIKEMRASLINEFVDRVAADVVKVDGAAERLAAAISSMISYAKENPEDYRFAFVDHADVEKADPVFDAKQRLLKFNVDICQDAIDAGVLGGDAVTRAHIMSFVVYGVGSLYGYPMVYGRTLDDLVEPIVELLFPVPGAKLRKSAAKKSRPRRRR
ncbi:MAG: TetR/AcrR family transcriptional regulator [Steroidobacteraceae bacterium]